MNGGFLTVSQLTGYIKTLLEADDVLGSVSVSGEISNITYHSSGHLYLTLKDEGATISAVMFRRDLERMSFRPENGMRIIASGRISVYSQQGRYQLYVSYMKPDGLGALYMALEALKKRLGAEGLFDPSRKKKLPSYPKRIGVVTSPTGAVIRDIIKVTGRRYPSCDIVLFPVHVQGDFAVGEICTGIEYFNFEKNVDLLIVGRGGGSIEDLWAFNSEAVVRAVASSELPVISAVGHQTDTTLCDLAADCVAGTPSMAAELAVPDVRAINEKLSVSASRINRAAQRKLDDCRMYLDDRYNVLELNSPKNRLERLLSEIAIKNNKFMSFADAKLKIAQMRLGEGAAKLSALSPLAVLSRGYGYVRTSDGKTVLSVSELKEGDGIDITMSDGHARARIEKVCKN